MTPVSRPMPLSSPPQATLASPTAARAVASKPAVTRPRHFVFLLLNQFTMMPFAGAIESLRLANRMSGLNLFSWSLAGEGGQNIKCSNGTEFRLDAGLGPLDRDDTVVVCGGLGIDQAASRPVIAWLRREARRGVTMAALCTGAYALARAGLLNGRRATIHWENRDGFSEEFADVELTRSVFVIDGDRITSAGGTATIDLMLRLIATQHGEDLAKSVADQMIHNTIRDEQDAQQSSGTGSGAIRHPKLSRAIQMMERHIEDPVSPSDVAEEIAMSTRQLERLFRRYLDRSPKRFYMELRLQKARNLLRQTEMSVINVALACGFASPSHFSRCYRGQYNTTPYSERGIQPKTTPEDKPLPLVLPSYSAESDGRTAKEERV